MIARRVCLADKWQTFQRKLHSIGEANTPWTDPTTVRSLLIMKVLDGTLQRPPKEEDFKSGMDLKTYKYLLDILASVIGEVFAENGQRSDNWGCAFWVTVLSHDVSYERILGSREI